MIVTGILIAFVLDAWWNDQIEQREIRDTLFAVHADFLSTQNELITVLSANRLYIEGVTALISLAPEEIKTAGSSKKVELVKLLPTGGSAKSGHRSRPSSPAWAHQDEASGFPRNRRIARFRGPACDFHSLLVATT